MIPCIAGTLDTITPPFFVCHDVLVQMMTHDSIIIHLRWTISNSDEWSYTCWHPILFGHSPWLLMANWWTIKFVPNFMIVILPFLHIWYQRTPICCMKILSRYLQSWSASGGTPARKVRKVHLSECQSWRWGSVRCQLATDWIGESTRWGGSGNWEPQNGWFMIINYKND